jgi:hypothetical protein
VRATLGGCSSDHQHPKPTSRRMALSLERPSLPMFADAALLSSMASLMPSVSAVPGLRSGPHPYQTSQTGATIRHSRYRGVTWDKRWAGGLAAACAPVPVLGSLPLQTLAVICRAKRLLLCVQGPAVARTHQLPRRAAPCGQVRRTAFLDGTVTCPVTCSEQPTRLLGLPCQQTQRSVRSPCVPSSSSTPRAERLALAHPSHLSAAPQVHPGAAGSTRVRPRVLPAVR